MDVQKDNVNNSRCSFEFFTHLKDINHNSYIAPSIFKFIDIKQFFTSLKSFISFLHISINTKFTNGKKRFQSIVYPNGEKTPNSKFIQGRSMIKGYKSVVFTVNKIQTIKMVFQDKKYKSKKTFMEENELYNFVHSLIAKDKVTKNFTTLKKQASKYSKDIKNSFVISRRFNIWVSFINYIRSKNEALTKLSLSPFY
ncbi:Hypothetical protein SRAE_1000255100 [Strongyloides ratti]|uniref:Uncharacterized protein n=1 Tax=Strongyloides ratti TaxID=34506 RepID=A0A090L3B5_STRRB|nr:Hypothetical protein SRAE_1000255100 [Strongyloides ratti]CEF64296.1 Hypothetical protein SRAE_1000255100 [Strongyloides ratti]